MSSAILNADMGTVARWLGEGWRWWVGELRALLPARLRRQRSTARGLVGWASPGASLAVTRDGNPAVPPAGTALPLALPPSACLLRTLTVPPLADADIRRLVTLQLDRLFPFPPGTALTDLALGAVLADQRSVTVAALPVASAAAAADAAAATGLVPTAIGIADPGEPLRFDFLPALRAARGEADGGRGRRFWWRAVTILFVLNVLLAIAADMLALRNVDRLVAAHGQSADLVRMARRRVLAEDNARRALLVRRSIGDPLPLLAELSRRMPAAAWAKRLDLEEQDGRLAGVRRDNADVLAALRGGTLLRDVHNTSGDVMAVTSEGQPFDISFTWSGPVR